MHTIKNPTNAPLDLETVGGTARLPAFGEVTDTFDPAYLEALRGYGMYEIAEAGEVEPELDDLRTKAEALGIDVDGRWGEKRLESEIAKAKKG